MQNQPPGAPGAEPVWTAAAKSGAGKAINACSEVVFTISNGIISEVYYPREDIACIKEIELIVTDGKDFFSEEKQHTCSETAMVREGVPAYSVVNTCRQNKYVIKKEIITDPIRSALLQKIIFTPQKSHPPLQLYTLISPHIGNKGGCNNGRIGDYKGINMLFASRDGLAIAVACSVPWLKRSVGYAGTSDAWKDLNEHKEMQWAYNQAENGNIVLGAQIDVSKNQDLILAIGFGRTEEEAGSNVWSSLLDGFSLSRDRYIDEWLQWQKKCFDAKTNGNATDTLLKTSATVLRLSEAKSFPGGIIASISIPWGTAKANNDLGGYHVVWPRDLVESCGGFLAIKAYEDAMRIANYLMSTQEEDGKWVQNMWLEGKPYWKAIQMDQIALPVLLIETCYNYKLIDRERMKRYWPIVKKALSFLVINGPATQQDRWEQQSGLSPYTLATEVAALLAGARLAEINNEKAFAGYCREIADYWNANIEEWTYVEGTRLAQEHDVAGYYVRINPYNQPLEQVKNKSLTIRHHNGNEGDLLIGEVISADALALVRFGLRAPDDPRILNTIRLIDATLKTDLPAGPCWHRFTKDAYGENSNGDPFTNSEAGIGRCWPLLTGERAHYEVAAGNIDQAKALLKTMSAFANNGLLPEQVWDASDIPEKDLYFGKHSQSAMPLTWAHAEYLKLSHSIQNKKVFDMPAHTRERYIKNKNGSHYAYWRFSWTIEEMPREKILRIEVLSPAAIHWSDDEWQTKKDCPTQQVMPGLHVAELMPVNKKAHAIQFTFFWPEAGRWENKNFQVYLK